MGQSETPWGSGGWMEGNMCGAHMYMSVFVCDGGVGSRKEEPGRMQTVYSS